MASEKAQGFVWHSFVCVFCIQVYKEYYMFDIWNRKCILVFLM